MPSTSPAQRIGFVIPTLGRNLAWLETTLRSITDDQPTSDVVLRVVTNNPDVAPLAEKYGAEVIPEQRRGLSQAINDGFASFREDPSIGYFAWLGDDDALAPGSLALAQKALEEHPTAPFVFGRLRYIDGEDRSKWVLRPGGWAVPYARVGHNFIGQPGSLFRREAFEGVGGVDESLKNSMDQDLFLNMAKRGKPVYLPRELAAFRVHPDSISSTKGEGDEMFDVRDRHRPKLPAAADKALSLASLVSNRILLSTHSRIPHGPAPRVQGRDYFAATPQQ